MQWTSILLLPTLMVTMAMPLVQSVPGSALVGSAVLATPVVVHAEHDAEVDDVNPGQEVSSGEKAVSTSDVKLYAALKPVCSCESGNGAWGEPSQFDKDGEVLLGKKNPNDIGMCQIHKPVWLETAIKLGFDIYTEEGNIKMANWIYDKHGLTPWKYSKSCWSKAL